MPVLGFQVEQGRGLEENQKFTVHISTLCVQLQCQKCLATNTAQYLLAGVFFGLLCSKYTVLITLIPT
jgi:hypothetical protein